MGGGSFGGGTLGSHDNHSVPHKKKNTARFLKVQPCHMLNMTPNLVVTSTGFLKKNGMDINKSSQVTDVNHIY